MTDLVITLETQQVELEVPPMGHVSSAEEMGRAIAQAVSRWLPTAAARVRAQAWSFGISGVQSGTVAGFLQLIRFPLPIFFPPVASHSPSSIIWGRYRRPVVVAIPSGLSLIPPIIIIVVIIIIIC
jgi:hypothetical protein